MAEAELFQRLTFGELYRRRVETAAQVASVSDGAEWIQGFIDFHAPDATRILDFPHAAQRICQIGEAVLGADHASLRAWQTRQLHDLKHAGCHWCARAPAQLRRRAAQRAGWWPRIWPIWRSAWRRCSIRRFQAAGWPIGSGMVESANKLVVEARLKGAGMHWSRASVNPLLALRNAVCNDRWAEAWQQSVAHIRREGMCRRSVEPKSAAEASSNPASVPIPAVSISETAALEVRAKPAGEHPCAKNRATKAAIAQATLTSKTLTDTRQPLMAYFRSIMRKHHYPTRTTTPLQQRDTHITRWATVFLRGGAMDMQTGQIKQCPHCHQGDGLCRSHNTYSCEACIRKAGGDPTRQQRGVICSVCSGKGSVWIGPDVVWITKLGAST